LTEFDVPNEPNTDNNNFIFLHGYNVEPNEARGVESAMFRRMFWSGSHAKFYGVTWPGYLSRAYIDYGFGRIAITPNYHTNVVSALVTSYYLTSFVNELNGTNTMAAHSLGNMVALSALNDWGARVNDYFMIDAAVPIEAIDPVAANTNMVHPSWYPYNANLWASDWYQLWSSGDGRSRLGWTSRFSDFNGANVYNFYSSGEEVLRTQVGPPPSVPQAFFDQAILDGIFNVNPQGCFVWAWQEKMKGTCAGNWVLGSDYGGWGFNAAYSGLTPAQANSLSNSVLQTNAFFSDSVDTAMFTTNSSGSAFAAANRSRLLADAIPAVSLAIGANHVTALAPQGQLDRNFDMEDSYENGWPVTTGNEAFKWHHSDVKAVAYLYTYQLFQTLVALGNLK
jgi:pimeloyl-ACP methyl ester carboxylesterase